MNKRKAPPILVADDDSILRDLLSLQLDRAGLNAETFEDGADLLPAVNEDTQVCILDLKMPIMGGMECLKKIKKKNPDTEVIILTTVNEAKDALQAMKDGAFDYITKPFDPDELVLSVRKASQLNKASKTVDELRTSVGFSPYASGVIGESDAMMRIRKLIDRVAPSENPVLLTGESGTGKGLLAREIHAKSLRKDKPFITVSCPSLPKDLLESEMFGHEKGAFSGAVARRLGRAELANGGTLFLDEIGEMPLELQPKLLNFLQEKTFFRVGGEKELEADVRIVAATNADLKAAVSEGSFREDLYFRLNVLPLEIPPLRQRDSDVLLLAQRFLERAAEREKIAVPILAKTAERLLSDFTWPGNVRQLENAIERAFVLRIDEDLIDVDDIPDDIKSGDSSVQGGASLVGMTLDEIEREAIIQNLKACGGNKAQTARRLGITEKSIYNKMKRFGI